MNRLEVISQIMEIGMRINLETEMACWIDVSGHVSSITIRVAASKQDFEKKLTRLEMYYDTKITDEQFKEKSERIINDLNEILSKKYSKTYSAYCNLIDMSCSQVFTSKTSAEAWVRKMERKYKSVYPITGIIENLVEEVKA